MLKLLCSSSDSEKALKQVCAKLGGGAQLAKQASRVLSNEIVSLANKCNKLLLAEKELEANAATNNLAPLII